MALEKTNPGHPALTGGGEIDLHSHPSGSGGANVKSGSKVGSPVTFTTAFATTPRVVAVPVLNSTSIFQIVMVYNISTTGFSFRVREDAVDDRVESMTDRTSSATIHWIATDAGNP